MAEKSINVIVGHEFRREREEQGFTQGEVAKKLGMNQTRLSRIETGVYQMRLAEFEQMCLFYRLSPSYVMGW